MATYRSPDGPIVGIGILLFSLGIMSIPLWMTEADLLGSHARRSGFMKLLEQSIGWTGFCIVMFLFGAWLAASGLSALWKFLVKKPDVTAHMDHLEFHPAIRRDNAAYEEVENWKIHFASGHPVLTINFLDPFWSLQGKWPRKSLVLEGGKEDLQEIVNFFSSHPYMADRYIG